MNLSTFIISLILAVIVILDIRYLMKNGIEGCSGDCSGSCHGSCKWVGDVKKAQRHLKWRRRIRNIFG